MAEKKNKYARKPATVKGAMKLAKEATKISKRLISGGKLNKAGKTNLVLKSITDPADKIAIKEAKSAKNIAKIKAKADSKELKRGIEGSRKDAGKEKARVRAKNKVTDVKNKVRREKIDRDLKQGKLKDKLKKSKASRVDDGTKVSNLVMRTPPKMPKGTVPPVIKKMKKDMGVPEGAHARQKPDATPTVKPLDKSKANVKTKDVASPDKKRPPIVVKGVSKKKMSKGKVATLAGASAITALGVNQGLKKDKKVETKKEVDASSSNAPKKTSQKAPTPKKGATPVKKVERNAYSAKTPKVEVKPEGKAKTLQEIADPIINKKNISPKNKAKMMADARKHIADKKKSNVPWEKIMESLTMLLSSHILSKGISKRYK